MRRAGFFVGDTKLAEVNHFGFSSLHDDGWDCVNLLAGCRYTWRVSRLTLNVRFDALVWQDATAVDVDLVADAHIVTENGGVL